MCAKVLLRGLPGMFLTEICEACLVSKICQQLCRVVSPGGVIAFCRLVFMVKFYKYV